MSAEYTRTHCKIAVAKILHTIGWHSINSTPLEVLTDILSNYIAQIAKITKDYSNEFGQTEPNLDHLGLAFQEMNVNLAELEEYVTFVNFIPPAHPAPKYPLPKESNLNFLKPGSKEVVTRPIHINEHLPPMYPLLEEQTEQNTETPVKNEVTEEEGSENYQFKKPADISSPEFKKLRKDEESGRPTREISSVMMTTSGFLSPAREGKLPEAKAPAPPPEPPKPPSPPPQVPELVPVKKKPDKKKEKIGKELFKPNSEEKIVKKINNMKDILKMQHAKALAANVNSPVNNFSPGLAGIQQLPPHHFLSHPFSDIKMPLVSHHKSPVPKTSNFNKALAAKALAAAKAKTEKLNTTITPIPIKSEPSQFQIPIRQVDKLVTEPDRKKINILKKISNVKDKHEKPRPHLNPNLLQQAHDIVSKINLSSDITIEPINPPLQQQHLVKTEPFYNDGSPPGTPPTPRTPELLAHSPPIPIKAKRKRKEKPERPKVKKLKKQPIPHFLDSEILDMSMGRPKTPDPHLILRKNPPFPPLPVASTPPLHFPFPLANFGGPGLIPPPLGNPLFPFSSPLPDFTKNPYFQPVPPKPEPIPKMSPKPKEIIKPEPAEIVPVPTPPLRVKTPTPPQPLPQPPIVKLELDPPCTEGESSKKSKDHKKEKKDKIKKKNKKEKIKDKTEKKKLKEAKKEKDKVKKEKKKKDQISKEESIETVPSIPKILLKVNSPSPRPETPDTMKKLNIKPVIKKEDISPERKQREPSPGLAKISALVTGPPKLKNPSPVTPTEKPLVEVTPPVPTPRPPGRPRIHPLKPKPPPKPKKVEQPFLKRDADGNEVWICPACGQQDDGRPMIGCDGCDAWYHWVCVGIQVPPDENENWYCKPCLAKKNEDLQDKKKKRKKKEKCH